MEPFAAPSEFLLVIWISHKVNASMRSIPLMERLRLLSSSLFSSSQKLKVFPARISNERSSHLGPFSMLFDAFSKEYIFITGLWSPGPLVRSESLFDPLFFWFCVYGAAPHPAASGLMMVKRVGIFLFPLYVSFSNDIALWLIARNFGFFDSFTAAVKLGRDFTLKSSMAWVGSFWNCV